MDDWPTALGSAAGGQQPASFAKQIRRKNGKQQIQPSDRQEVEEEEKTTTEIINKYEQIQLNIRQIINLNCRQQHSPLEHTDGRTDRSGAATATFAGIHRTGNR